MYVKKISKIFKHQEENYTGIIDDNWKDWYRNHSRPFSKKKKDEEEWKWLVSLLSTILLFSIRDRKNIIFRITL